MIGSKYCGNDVEVCIQVCLPQYHGELRRLIPQEGSTARISEIQGCI
jgi:hypothetical protein